MSETLYTTEDVIAIKETYFEDLEIQAERIKKLKSAMKKFVDCDRSEYYFPGFCRTFKELLK